MVSERGVKTAKGSGRKKQTQKRMEGGRREFWPEELLTSLRASGDSSVVVVVVEAARPEP